MKLYTLMNLIWHIWNIETSFVKTTAFNLLVWQVQIFLKKTGCTMPLARFVFSKSKGLIIRVIQAGDTTAWHDWYLGRRPEEMECQTGDDRTVQWVLGTSWNLMFFNPGFSSCWVTPTGGRFCWGPFGVKANIETWKVQTWFVFVCVWRKTPSPFLPRNKFVKRSGPPSFSFRLWSPLAVFPTENPIQPGVIQILRGVQQNKVAYPVPKKCSRGYI